MKPKIKIKLVDFWSDFSMFHHFLFDLLKDKYEVVESDNPDFLFYSCYGNEHKKYRCTKIFYTGENIRPNYYDCDFSLSFDANSYEGRNYRLPLFLLYSKPEVLIISEEDVNNIKRKTAFCNLVVSNANATERIDFFQKLSEYKKVDSGGKYLNNIGGPVEDKMEFINQYKFTIAFENSSSPGYTTEKILQPMLMNSIPVYWGNPNISEDFNTKRFINIHEFGSHEKAIERIIEIDRNPELYHSILSEPFFVNNKVPAQFKSERILEFLECIFRKKYKSNRLRQLSRPIAYSFNNAKSTIGLQFYRCKRKLRVK